MNLVNKSTANKGGIYFDEMRCRKISFILYINIQKCQNYDIIQLAVGIIEKAVKSYLRYEVRIMLRIIFILFFYIIFLFLIIDLINSIHKK